MQTKLPSAAAAFLRWAFYLSITACGALAIAMVTVQPREWREALGQACLIALAAAALALVGMVWGRRRAGRLPESQSTFFVDSRPGI